MKIDFSKFKPEDFLPILGTTCPALDDLQTGDLLFPRLSDAVEAKSEKRDSYWFPRMAAILKNSKNNETPIKDILGEQAVAEIMKKIETRQYTQHRTLDITAVMADGLAEALNRKHNSSSISTKFDEFHENNLLSNFK